MTPVTTIQCPNCGGAANFAFVTWVIINRQDLSYFTQSQHYDVVRGQHTHGSYFQAAVFYPGLGVAPESIDDLPKRYSSEMWRSKRYFSPPKELRNRGAFHCPECFTQRKHTLSWPDEAFYQIEHKDRVLWAYDRTSTVKLLAYLVSNERRKSVEYFVGNPWQKYTTEDWFLRHIPTHFQTAKARPHVVKKLRKLLKLA